MSKQLFKVIFSFSLIGFSLMAQAEKKSSETTANFFTRELTEAYRKSNAHLAPKIVEKTSIDYLNEDVLTAATKVNERHVESSEVGEHVLMEKLYSVLLPESRWQSDYFNRTSSIMNTNVWEDLGIIATNGVQPDFSLVNLVAKPATILGKSQLGVLLVTPTTEIGELTRRQSIISEFRGEKGRIVSHLFKQNAINVNETIKFWNETDLFSRSNPHLLNIRQLLTPYGKGRIAVEVASALMRFSTILYGAIFPLGGTYLALNSSTPAVHLVAAIPDESEFLDILRCSMNTRFISSCVVF